jgi:hypothetical protein
MGHVTVDQQTRAPGRPSRFTPSLAMRICQAIAEGKSLRSVCLMDGMPHISTVLDWVNCRPEFAEQYARAREARADMLAEDMIHIADTPCLGVKTETSEKGVKTIQGDMVEHRKLQIDARKWNAARMAPKKYGDKSETTLKGDAMAPVALVLNGSDVHG